MNRPECFEFSMAFLGGQEEAEIRRYIEELERDAQKCHDDDNIDCLGDKK